MPFQSPPRPPSVLGSVLAAAAVVLTVAGCTGHITPLGPDQTARPRSVAQAGPPIAVPVRPIRLRSPFVLEAMRVQPPTAAGGCPAGSVALSGGPGRCYRKLGAPVTITSAAVSSVFSYRPPAPPGQPPGPLTYGFVVVIPGADMAALSAVTTTAADVHGHLSISVAGRTWLLAQVLQPFTQPQLQISLPSRNQTLQLQRTLTPSG